MYAKELTKEYLQKLGITEITKDGKHIYIGEKEAKQSMIPSGYLVFHIYDKEIRDIVYPITKSRSAGELLVPVQRAVYAWYHGSTVENMVIDHINDIKTDNRIENFMILCPNCHAQTDNYCSKNKINKII